MKYLVLALLIIGCPIGVRAITVNPASGTTGDSAATPQTIVYRDTVGAAQFVYISVGSLTITQLLATVPTSTGNIYYCSNCSPAKLVVSTGTSAGNWADPAGGAFK